MIAGTSALWRTVRPELILWSPWETGCSVFNGNTGETHLLSELPAEVLRQLSNAPMTGEALAKELARLCEVEETPDWPEKISQILSELAEIEVIESIAP
jgi:PqqD family protein of HPr-rel-A system